MFESLISTNSVSLILVFFEGIISFFSPCVIPLIPVYISFLAGNAKQVGEDGFITYQRKKVFVNTVSFVLGISFAFFVLGMSFSALRIFFYSNKLLFTRLGGILIIMLGLFQLEVFHIKLLRRDRKFNLNLDNKKVNPLLAFIMGFTFSFAWTPCVGPALSSVLILASGAKSALTGNMLVLIYAGGFIIPFLILGLFTTQTLNFLKKNQKLLKYTIRVGGVILILIGVMTFTGWMNGISSYMNSFISPSTSENEPEDEAEDKTDIDTEDEEPADSPKGNLTYPAPDFTLFDQFGNEHTLSDYKGKVVFLNFWATWCPPCQKEMPHIEELYAEYNFNEDDVVILGVANPKSDDYPYNQDVSEDEIKEFLTDNEYTFPVVFDVTGDIFKKYFIQSFPTTFMIDKEGNIYGHVPGMLTKGIMQNIIQETLDSAK
jgi:cytochrome c-type biogenesis protein